MWVRSLDQEDPLEEKIATFFSIPAWRIPWTEEPGRLSPWCCKESDTTELAQTHIASIDSLNNSPTCFSVVTFIRHSQYPK